MNHEKDIHENGRFHGQDIKFSGPVHKKGRFHGHAQDFDLRCPPVDFSADGERTRTMAQI